MINLLPNQQKEELRREQNLKVVLILGIIVLAFLICSFLILFLIRTSFLAEVEVQKIYFAQREEKLINPRIQELEMKIKNYNLVIGQLAAFYQERPDLSPILQRVSLTLPPAVYLTSFSFDHRTSRFSLTGFSPDRQKLLQFRETLEKTEGIKEVSFPPGTWVHLTDINFSVTFKK